MNSWNELYTASSLSSIHTKLSIFNSESYKLHQKDFYHEAISYLRLVFARARYFIDIATENLVNDRYVFAFPNEKRGKSDPSVLDRAVELAESKRIYLPLSIVAWISEIGNVNFCGTHPEWGKTGYAFEGNTNEVLYTDPLFFELDKESILYQYEEWLYQIEECGEDEIGPFKISISPDYIHKANVSGGVPYEVYADKMQFDSFLLNERHGGGVIYYLRNSLYWGGFPGFEYIKDFTEEKKKSQLTNMII